MTSAPAPAARLLETRRVLHPRTVAVSLLGMAAVLFSFWAISVGWTHSLFDYHSFRQTQTAIVSYYMMHGGGVFRYQMPIFGPPWSIPFEFPLYQWLVAGASRLLSSPLEMTGRAVSVIFYFLTFIPLADVLLSLRFTRMQIAVTLVLFAASPFYIFHSRCFMIESTALFFSVVYLALLFRLVKTKRKGITGFGVLVCGALAGLVKVTTFAPFLLAATAVLAVRLWRQHRQHEFEIPSASFALVCAVIVPVAITAAWTHYADTVKSQNLIAVGLTSRALLAWNFGTLGQRLALRNYFPFARVVNGLVGSFAIPVLVLGLGYAFCRRVFPAALACLALYGITIEIFFNLHHVHSYYAYANGIFLITAVGVVLGALIELPGLRGWLGVSAFAATLACCGYMYFFGLFFMGRSMYQMQSANAPGRPAATAFVAQSTRPDDVIVVLGLRWSSDFAYQARRRSIMDPWTERGSDLLPLERNGGLLKAAIQNEGPARIASVVSCDEGRASPRLRSALELSSMPALPQFRGDGCDVYLRQPD